jgi:hypothetical protein
MEGGHALALTRAIQHLTNELPHAIQLDLKNAEAPPTSPFNRFRHAWREGLRGREAFGRVVQGRAYLVRVAYLAGSYAFGYRVRCCGTVDGGGKDRSSLTRCRKRVAWDPVVGAYCGDCSATTPGRDAIHRVGCVVVPLIVYMS